MENNRSKTGAENAGGDGAAVGAAARSVGVAFTARNAGLSGGGHASVSGGAAFKFGAVGELHEKFPETLWISSTTPNRFLHDHGLRKAWLRHGLFFHTPVVSIAEEIGIDHADLPAAASAVSAIASRVCAIAEHHIPTLDLNDEHGHTLADSVCRAIYNTHRPAVEDQRVIEPLGATVHQPLPPSGDSSSNDLLIRIPVQRVSHLERVMSTSVPTGLWEEVAVSELQDAKDWVLKCERPVLALIWIAKPHPKLTGLIPKASSRGVRVWVAFPEFAVITGCAEVRVERVLVAEQYVPCASGFRLPPPTFDPVDHAAISSGLFAESYVAAACNMMPPGQPQGQGVFSRNTARSAWLLSAARAVVFTEAVKLITNDFNVIGYGLSHILLSLPKGDLSELKGYIAQSKTLLFPARFANAIEEQGVAA